jgi:hypothetical protein
VSSKDRPNLTVLSYALVTRLTFEAKRVTGVEISYDGSTHRIRAGREMILSLATTRFSCNRVSAIKPNCSASEFPSCSICRESGTGSKTILLLSASGSILRRLQDQYANSF